MAEMLLISLLLNYTGVILNSQCSEADKCFEITMMKSFSIKVRFVPSDQYVSLNSSDCKKKKTNKTCEFCVRIQVCYLTFEFNALCHKPDCSVMYI